MASYQVTITFDSNTKLTETEFSTLQSMIALQVAEPVNFDGEDEEYKATNIIIDGFEVK